MVKDGSLLICHFSIMQVCSPHPTGRATPLKQRQGRNRWDTQHLQRDRVETDRGRHWEKSETGDMNKNADREIWVVVWTMTSLLIMIITCNCERLFEKADTRDKNRILTTSKDFPFIVGTCFELKELHIINNSPNVLLTAKTSEKDGHYFKCWLWLEGQFDCMCNMLKSCSCKTMVAWPAHNRLKLCN